MSVWLSVSGIKFSLELYKGLKARFVKRREQNHSELVISVMPIGKTQNRFSIATRAGLSDAQTLAALCELRDRGRVITLKVDEEPPLTLWNRLG